MYYLQKVEILLEKKECEERFSLLCHSLTAEGIEVVFSREGQATRLTWKEGWEQQAVLLITVDALYAG